MIRTTGNLLEDVRRGPLAALLILLGLCAGLAPLSGSAQTARDPLVRSGSVRLVAPAASARSAERLVVEKAAAGEEHRPFLKPPPPRLVVFYVARLASAPAGGQAVLGLPSLAAHLYRARAPPAA